MSLFGTFVQDVINIKAIVEAVIVRNNNVLLCKVTLRIWVFIGAGG